MSDYYCTDSTHFMIAITEGDYERCGECGGRLADKDARKPQAKRQMEPHEYLEVVTHIREGGVYFGDEKLTGLIADGGVTVRYAEQGDGCNRLIVEFLVGQVLVDDPLGE